MRAFSILAIIFAALFMTFAVGTPLRPRRLPPATLQKPRDKYKLVCTAKDVPVTLKRNWYIQADPWSNGFRCSRLAQQVQKICPNIDSFACNAIDSDYGHKANFYTDMDCKNRHIEVAVKKTLMGSLRSLDRWLYSNSETPVKCFGGK